MTEQQRKSLKWVDDIIQGNKRGKGEIDHLKNLIDIIDELFTENEILRGRK